MSQINNPYTAVNWSMHEDDFTLMFYKAIFSLELKNKMIVNPVRVRNN